MHNRRPAVAVAVLTLAVATVLAACTGSAGGSQATAADAGSSGGETISIASPAAGSEVTVPFDVQLESSVALGEPETGNHHAHLYFDTGTDSPEYDIVYSDTWQVTRPLTPGEHQITVALANPDHSLAGPTQTVSVVVGDGAAGGPSAAPAATSVPPPGY